MALHMSTIVSRKTADIVAHIDRLRPRVAGSSLLYAISTTNQTQPSDVSHLYSSLKTLSEDSVGCLTAPIPSSRPSWQRSFAVSVASFDPKHATLFRSTIPGRKAVQVGRWRAPDQHGKQPDRGEYSEDIEWGKAFAQFSGTTSLPPSIDCLRYSKPLVCLRSCLAEYDYLPSAHMILGALPTSQTGLPKD